MEANIEVYVSEDSEEKMLPCRGLQRLKVKLNEEVIKSRLVGGGLASRSYIFKEVLQAHSKVTISLAAFVLAT